MVSIYIDEAGRGPLAGPICLGIILELNNNYDNVGFADSKKISEKKREIFFEKIEELKNSGFLFFNYKFVHNNFIDKYGVSASMKKLLVSGIKGILKQSSFSMSQVNYIYFDGNTDFGASKELGIKINTIKSGDSKVVQIGMASIVAKVVRDLYMKKIDSLYPDYQLGKNKGYGTLYHRNIIKEKGPTIYHRKTFLKNLI
ncbi:ribonuclease HII [Candidatus Absconditicoccus praedator]|uniref:ribonuclease HII n=1 Tax=Candidatus Absconditicoccus praedator TaxID=2735562 RepID=UPI001E426187|nr:ribonuclease HII [Candidatus Absconditicoccus praedator]UFX83076.1 ribonuclease HII [Candidatus Absconditicoccus praedator]